MLKGSLLQKLALAHQNHSKPLNLGVYYKNTLVALCHALEDFVLESDSNPVMITAFQRGKWYLEEAERYGDLADKAQKIAIMAASDAGFSEHPTSKKSNVALVPLKEPDPVAQEWHLMIISSSYTAMVLCQELSDEDYGIEGRPPEDLERKFYGFWTFESDLVQETVGLAIEHIRTYDLELATELGDRISQIKTKHQQQSSEELASVVAKVVGYLENCKVQLHSPLKDVDYNFFEDLDNNIASNEMQAFLRMAQIIDLTDTLNPMAASEVATLGEAMGQLLDLPAWQIKRLRLAGLLHRLSLSSKSDSEFNQTSIQKEALQNKDQLPQSSVLRIMPQLEAISKILDHQTEVWNGAGNKSGLAYDSIPLESRILRLIEDFQKQVITLKNKQQDQENILLEAFASCQAQAGIIYDPKLVEALNLIVVGMQQGMTLQAYQPKIAGGIWLLD